MHHIGYTADDACCFEHGIVKYEGEEIDKYSTMKNEEDATYCWVLENNIRRHEVENKGNWNRVVQEN